MDDYNLGFIEGSEAVRNIIKAKIKKLEKDLGYYAVRNPEDFEGSEFDAEMCEEIRNKISILKEILEESNRWKI